MEASTISTELTERKWESRRVCDGSYLRRCQPSTLKYKSTSITASHLYAVLYTKYKEDYGIAAHLIMELVC